MPELAQYPAADPAQLTHLAEGERNQRLTTIRKALDYYAGKMPRPLKVKPGQVDDNVIVNLVRRVINQSAAMLVGTPPEFELPEQVNAAPEQDAVYNLPDEADTSPEELALERLWELNKAEVFLTKLATQGGLTGHCYVKLQPDQVKGVRFILQKAEILTVFWKPDDVEDVVCYMLDWPTGVQGERRRQDIVALEGGWEIRDFVQRAATGWQLVQQPEPWRWPFCPLVDWQNLPNAQDYYGLADLSNPAINDAVNFSASNVNRILKFHAHPKTVGTGFETSELVETRVEGFWSIPQADAKVFNLEMQSDLSSSMAFITFLRDAFYSEHQAVDLTALRDKIGQITNFGLALFFNDSLDKLKVKRALYGQGLCELGRRALVMLGQRDITPVVRWPSPLPQDVGQQAAAEQVKIAMGVESKETAAGNLGLDWREEQRRLAGESQGDTNIGARLLAAFEKGGQPGGGLKVPLAQPPVPAVPSPAKGELAGSEAGG